MYRYVRIWEWKTSLSHPITHFVWNMHGIHAELYDTWGRGWMTKASGVGERRKGRGELRRDCHHRVAALFVPTRMQQWYIDIWYITMIYMGEGAGGGPFAWKITWCPWAAPPILAKARRLQLADASFRDKSHLPSVSMAEYAVRDVHLRPTEMILWGKVHRAWPSTTNINQDCLEGNPWKIYSKPCRLLKWRSGNINEWIESENDGETPTTFAPKWGKYTISRF